MGSQWAAIGSCQRPMGRLWAAPCCPWAPVAGVATRCCHGPSVVNGPGLGPGLKPTQELSPNLNPTQWVGFYI